jgi:hypothetical protein
MVQNAGGDANCARTQEGGGRGETLVILSVLSYYMDALAECLVCGGDVARLTEMVLRSMERFEQST